MIFEADFPALSKKAVKPIIGPRGVAYPRCPFGLGLGRYSGAAPRATRPAYQVGRVGSGGRVGRSGRTEAPERLSDCGRRNP